MYERKLYFDKNHIPVYTPALSLLGSVLAKEIHNDFKKIIYRLQMTIYNPDQQPLHATAF